MATAHDPYLKDASERYRRAHFALDQLVHKLFDGVERVMAYDMPMWRIARPDDAPRPEQEGTMPSDFVHVGLVARKASLTLHLWYPGDYYLLDHHKDALKAAGLKPMRGCVQFTRKGDLPVEAIVPLLEAVKQGDGLA